MTEPRWHDEAGQWIVSEDGLPYVVGVVPMIFNDRIVVSVAAEFPHRGYVAGWCYDKGVAALVAALAWNPEDGSDPVGYKKVACDGRDADPRWLAVAETFPQVSDTH